MGALPGRRDHSSQIRLRPGLPAAGAPVGPRGTRPGRPRHQRVDHAALPGAGRLRDLDRATTAGSRDASRARARGGRAPELVNPLLFALAWAVVGGAGGGGSNYLTRRPALM